MKAEIYSPEESSKLVQESHTIRKMKKPKIRIIHIVAPEIIKTDVQNFRDIVQKLTGKPSAPVTKTKRRRRRRNYMQTQDNQGIDQVQMVQLGAQRILKKEPIVLQDIYSRGDSSSSNALFNYDDDGVGYVDVDHHHHNNFIQDFTEYPNLLLPFKSSQINMFGEMHLC